MSELKLMSFNILRDGQYEAGDRKERIASVIRDTAPDVLCMQEGGDDPFWAERAATEGFNYVENLPGQYCPSLYAKLGEGRIEGLADGGNGFLRFRTTWAGRTLGIYCVHLYHEAHADATRAKELNVALSAIAEAGDELVCVAGDFNSRTRGERGEDWIVEIASCEGGIPVGEDDWHRAVGLMVDAGFVDTYRAQQDDPGYTYHPSAEYMANSPVFQALTEPPPKGEGAESWVSAGVRIDYIFANPAMADLLTECRVIDTEDAYLASDHLPLAAIFKTGH